MTLMNSLPVPTNNRCAQCGHIIGEPDWMETNGDDRVMFVWRCTACDYEFETIAVYSTKQPPLAA
jgi:rubredoxin